MMRKNRIVEIIKILESILIDENRPMSIREISIELRKRGIKKSPQVILKYLKILEKKGRISEGK